MGLRGLFVVKNGKRGVDIEHKVMECLPGMDTILSAVPTRQRMVA